MENTNKCKKKEEEKDEKKWENALPQNDPTK